MSVSLREYIEVIYYKIGTYSFGLIVLSHGLFDCTTCEARRVRDGVLVTKQ